MKQKPIDTRALDGRCSDSSCKGKGSYLVPVSCGNCGWRGSVRFTKGHDSYGIYEKCPECECQRLDRDHNREVVTR